jgi:hypothetical protein
MTEERLRRLAESVRVEHYVTTREDLEKMKNLHQEGVLKEMGEITLALFYQLQAPGTGADGIDPDEQCRRVLKRIKEIFGVDSEDAPPGYVPGQTSRPQVVPQDGQVGVAPDLLSAPAGPPPGSQQAAEAAAQARQQDERYPSISAAEWEARERPRQLLENLLTRQVRSCREQRQALLKESVQGPSPYERAAEIAPTHPDARLMRRMQDSNLREVRRLTSLLLRIKRYQSQMEA